jgi:hypothetical protein
VRSVLTVYLIIAAGVVMIFKGGAGQFLRPVALVMIGLVFLPPIFTKLVQSLRATLIASPLPVDWLIVPIAVGLVVFILFRIWNSRRRAKVPKAPKVLRERERVTPHFDLGDHPGEENLP